MTVVEEGTGPRVDMAKVAPMLTAAALAVAVALGGVYAIANSGNVDVVTPAQIDQLNKLNASDIAPGALGLGPFLFGSSDRTHVGRTSSSSTGHAPFLTDQASPTHTGRTSP